MDKTRPTLQDRKTILKFFQKKYEYANKEQKGNVLRYNKPEHALVQARMSTRNTAKL